VSKQVWLDLRKVDANEGLDLPLPSITRYDGTFEFGAVIPGSYVLSALTDAGYIRMPLEVGDHDIDDLRVAVQPFLALQGRFRWEGGAPADAGELKATLQPLIPASDRTAQAVNGAFQFTHLLPGKMRVSVSKLSAQDYVKTILYGNAAIDDEVIDIVEGAELEVVLKRGAASVSGTVSTDQSDSAGPFTVLLIPKSRPNARGLYRSGTADPQGHFQLTGIAPGEYVLLAMEAVEQDAWFEPDFLARYGRDGESIKFEENARELRTLKLIR
jgi:hypothetical protein